MIATVGNEYKWPPEIMGGLFFDAEDYMGLEFWYNEVREQTKQIKEMKRKKR